MLNYKKKREGNDLIKKIYRRQISILKVRSVVN